MNETAGDANAGLLFHRLFRLAALCYGSVCLAFGLYTGAFLLMGVMPEFVGPLWLIAVLFQVLAAGSAVLARSSRHLNPGGLRAVSAALWINGFGLAVWGGLFGWLLIEAWFQ